MKRQPGRRRVRPDTHEAAESLLRVGALTALLDHGNRDRMKLRGAEVQAQACGGPRGREHVRRCQARRRRKLRRELREDLGDLTGAGALQQELRKKGPPWIRVQTPRVCLEVPSSPTQQAPLDSLD